MFCLCGSSKRPIDPSLVPAPVPVQDVSAVQIQDVSSTLVQDVSSTLVQDVSSTLVQDVSSTLVQDVSSTPVQDVSSTPVQDVSSTPVQEDEPCPIDVSGTDQIIEKIDEVLRETPVMHAEDHIETAIASLWLPPRPGVAATGSPMSRATTRG
jgi:hypothetical protein